MHSLLPADIKMKMLKTIHVMSSLLLQSCIVVEVPPYHSKTVGSAVQVQFYVCNGKRKRSQSQRFTYLSGRKSRSHSSLGFTVVFVCFFFFHSCYQKRGTRLADETAEHLSVQGFTNLVSLLHFFFVVSRGVFHQQYH